MAKNLLENDMLHLLQLACAFLLGILVAVAANIVIPSKVDALSAKLLEEIKKLKP